MSFKRHFLQVFCIHGFQRKSWGGGGETQGGKKRLNPEQKFLTRWGVGLKILSPPPPVRLWGIISVSDLFLLYLPQKWDKNSVIESRDSPGCKKRWINLLLFLQTEAELGPVRYQVAFREPGRHRHQEHCHLRQTGRESPRAFQNNDGFWQKNNGFKNRSYLKIPTEFQIYLHENGWKGMPIACEKKYKLEKTVKGLFMEQYIYLLICEKSSIVLFL